MIFLSFFGAANALTEKSGKKAAAIIAREYFLRERIQTSVISTTLIVGVRGIFVKPRHLLNH